MANIPLEDYPSHLSAQTSPSRQLTLESQRGGIRSLANPLLRLFPRSRDSDPFEEEIRQKAQEQHNQENLPHFLSDYRRLKTRSGAEIAKCLVWYKSFAPNTARPAAECEYYDIW